MKRAIRIFCHTCKQIKRHTESFHTLKEFIKAFKKPCLECGEKDMDKLEVTSFRKPEKIDQEDGR